MYTVCTLPGIGVAMVVVSGLIGIYYNMIIAWAIFFLQYILCTLCTLSGIGVAMVVVSGLVGIYYNMIIAWALYYLFASFTSELPWSECKEDWAGDCK